MSISNSLLKTKSIKEMNIKSIVTEGEFAKASDLAEVIVNAVVEEITSNVLVDKGSSTGSFYVL
ncbi:hypothetical protein [Aliivibrio fischeri]|uniref:hypothetical protein n=1 Tax=Aliivibrio fischeri TaxID=668 RepID=UPI00084C2F3D|nr:hypothetical protein [Aliivibrio fischeri]MUJ28003.1 hypothetical protein [Aliivibrio fischeri]OED55512.1 hypothetical protein BEI47_14820 [Aliivibrio fischeri]